MLAEGCVCEYRLTDRQAKAVEVGPGGSVVAALFLRETIYELSIFILQNGFTRIGTARISVPISDTPYSPSQYFQIIWSPLANRLCVIIGDSIVILKLKWLLYNDVAEASLITVTEVCSKDDTVIDEVVRVHFTSINEWTTKGIASAILGDLGRYVFIGTKRGALCKYDWAGNKKDFIEISDVHDLLRVWEQPTLPFAAMDSGPEGNGESVDSDAAIMRAGDDVHIRFWSERHRMLVTTLSDGSLVLVRNLQSGFAATVRIHLTMLAVCMQSSGNAEGGNGSANVQSLLLDSADMAVYQSLDSKPSRTKREIASRICALRCVDATSICGKNCCKILVILKSQHFPQDVISETRLTTSFMIIDTENKLCSSEGSNRGQGGASVNGAPDAPSPSIQIPAVTESVTLSCAACLHLREDTRDPMTETATADDFPVALEVMFTANSCLVLTTVAGQLTCRPLDEPSVVLFQLDLMHMRDMSVTDVFSAEYLANRVHTFTAAPLVLTCLNRLLVVTNTSESMRKGKSMYLPDDSDEEVVYRSDLSEPVSPVQQIRNTDIMASNVYVVDLLGFDTSRNAQGAFVFTSLTSETANIRLYNGSNQNGDVLDEGLNSDSETCVLSAEELDLGGPLCSRIPLPGQLVGELRSFHTKVGMMGPYQTGRTDRLIQDGLIVANSAQQLMSLRDEGEEEMGQRVNTHSVNGKLHRYLAVAVGNAAMLCPSSFRVSLAKLYGSEADDSSNVVEHINGAARESTGLWLYNMNTRKWREADLHLSEASEDTLYPQPSSDRTRRSSSEARGSIPLIPSSTRISGPLTSVLSLAWYDEHTLVMLCMRQSRCCLELFTREISKTSPMGNTIPAVHKVIPLAPGYTPRHFDVLMCAKEDRPVLERDWDNAGHIATTTTAIVVVGDDANLTIYNVQALECEKNMRSVEMGKRVNVIEYQVNIIHEVGISATCDDGSAIRYPLKTILTALTPAETMCRSPIRLKGDDDYTNFEIEGANGVDHSAMHSGNSKGVCGLMIFILDAGGKVLTMNISELDTVSEPDRSQVRLQTYSIGPHSAITRVICRPAKAPARETTNHRSFLGPTMVVMHSAAECGSTLLSQLRRRSSWDLDSENADRWPNLTSVNTSYIWFTSLLPSSTDVSKSEGCLQYMLSFCERSLATGGFLGNDAGASVFVRNIGIGFSKQAVVVVREHFMYTLFRYFLHVVRDHFWFQVKKKNIAKASLQGDARKGTVESAFTKEKWALLQIALSGLEQLVATVIDSQCEAAGCIKHLEFYAKSVVDKFCYEATTAERAKAAIEYRTLMSVLHKDRALLFTDMLSSVSRKLEPEVSHRLFPLPLLDWSILIASNWTEATALYDSFCHPLMQPAVIRVTALDLFEETIKHGRLEHASRFLTLACTSFGATESISSAQLSLIVALELIYECIRSMKLIFVVQAVEFALRVERVKAFLTDDNSHDTKSKEDRTHYRFDFHAGREDKDGLVYVRKKKSKSTSASVLASTPSVVISSRESAQAGDRDRERGSEREAEREGERERVRAADPDEERYRALHSELRAVGTSEGLSRGLSGRVFSVLGGVSPALSYYVGGSTMWAVANAVTALAPAPGEGGREGDGTPSSQRVSSSEDTPDSPLSQASAPSNLNMNYPYWAYAAVRDQLRYLSGTNGTRGKGTRHPKHTRRSPIRETLTPLPPGSETLPFPRSPTAWTTNTIIMIIDDMVKRCAFVSLSALLTVMLRSPQIASALAEVTLRCMSVDMNYLAAVPAAQKGKDTSVYFESKAECNTLVMKVLDAFGLGKLSLNTLRNRKLQQPLSLSQVTTKCEAEMVSGEDFMQSTYQKAFPGTYSRSKVVTNVFHEHFGAGRRSRRRAPEERSPLSNDSSGGGGGSSGMQHSRDDVTEGLQIFDVPPETFAKSSIHNNGDGYADAGPGDEFATCQDSLLAMIAALMLCRRYKTAAVLSAALFEDYQLALTLSALSKSRNLNEGPKIVLLSKLLHVAVFSSFITRYFNFCGELGTGFAMSEDERSTGCMPGAGTSGGSGADSDDLASMRESLRNIRNDDMQKPLQVLCYEFAVIM